MKIDASLTDPASTTAGSSFSKTLADKANSPPETPLSDDAKLNMAAVQMFGIDLVSDAMDDLDEDLNM